MISILVVENRTFSRSSLRKIVSRVQRRHYKNHKSEPRKFIFGVTKKFGPIKKFLAEKMFV